MTQRYIIPLCKPHSPITSSELSFLYSM